MRSMLVVAHGSRRAASNDEVRALADRVREHTKGQFDDVRCAFLELADPLIPDGIRQCAAAGADEVVVVPYFLSAGRHVVEDIPAEIDSVREELSHVTIRQSDYLGSMDCMVELLVKASQPSDGDASSKSCRCMSLLGE